MLCPFWGRMQADNSPTTLQKPLKKQFMARRSTTCVRRSRLSTNAMDWIFGIPWWRTPRPIVFRRVAICSVISTSASFMWRPFRMLWCCARVWRAVLCDQIKCAVWRRSPKLGAVAMPISPRVETFRFAKFSLAIPLRLWWSWMRWVSHHAARVPTTCAMSRRVPPVASILRKCWMCCPTPRRCTKPFWIIGICMACPVNLISLLTMVVRYPSVPTPMILPFMPCACQKAQQCQRVPIFGFNYVGLPDTANLLKTVACWLRPAKRCLSQRPWSASLSKMGIAPIVKKRAWNIWLMTGAMSAFWRPLRKNWVSSCNIFL